MLETTPLVEETLEAQPHGGSLKRSKKSEILEQYEPSLASQSLSEEAAKTLSTEDNATLKVIAKFIGNDGLQLEEACAIANVKLELLQEKMVKYPIIKKIIEIKKMEYKHMLLSRLAIRARSGDDKVAQWLLETRYPDEFGTKKKGGGVGDGEDIMAQAISFIQENGDSSPVVRKTSTIINIKRVPAAKSDEVKRLKAFLT